MLSILNSLHDLQDVSNGFVFLDWFAIPSITVRKTESDVKSEVLRAVRSIPAYVEVADLFVSLVPELITDRGRALTAAENALT